MYDHACMYMHLQGRRQKFLKGFSNQHNTTSYDDSTQYYACAIARFPCMDQMSGVGGGGGGGGQ